MNKNQNESDWKQLIKDRIKQYWVKLNDEDDDDGIDSPYSSNVRRPLPDDVDDDLDVPPHANAERKHHQN